MTPSAAEASNTVKYLWDFFGPHAERTAVHFEKHLREFLVDQQCADVVTGGESAGDGHYATYCLSPPELAAKLKEALRPNRAVSP